MNAAYKILHLEDNPDDAELVGREIRKAFPKALLVHVDNREEYRSAIDEYYPDIILSDHSLPSMDSHEALQLLRQSKLVIPFILITATVSEEYAVTIIREGADDYILKERLQRLPTAIDQAIEKYSIEKSKQLAEESLKASERKYKLLFEHNPLPMWMVSRSTLAIIDVNEAAIRHYGYSEKEFLSMNASDLRPAEDIARITQQVEETLTDTADLGIWQHVKKDGTVIFVNIIAHDVELDGSMVRLLLGNDVTEKLRVEKELAAQQQLITETAIRAQEKERQEIGKELHDNISQLLATAVLYLDFAVKKDQLQSEALSNSRTIILNAIDEVRALSHTLAGPATAIETLDEAIGNLVEKMRKVSPINLFFYADDYIEHNPDKDKKLMLYRIVQEQLNNIFKHSFANKATVTLSANENEIKLLIEDDGAGFDMSQRQHGIGLRNIANRISMYHGSVEIRSAPGQGCVLELKVPV